MTTGPWNQVLDALKRGIEARKCHPCGCFHGYVEALEGDGVAAAEPPPGLSERVGVARAALQPSRYDCLGCEVCFPADGSAALERAAPGLAVGLCAIAPIEEREEWPPLPGDYVVVDGAARIAVCCLTSRDLFERLSASPPPGAAIVGLLFTENLGIERMVRNILANPRIGGLVIAGADSARRIGHQAGATLVALLDHGTNDAGQIIEAPGKRPWLKNLDLEAVEAFRRRMTVVTAIGEEKPDRIAQLVGRLSRSLPETAAVEGVPAPAASATFEVTEVPPLRLDPAGWFVIDPVRRSRRIRVEHYTNEGALDLSLVGVDPAALIAECVEQRLVTRLDHAAYLGRELDRARRAIDEGVPYRQDAAPDSSTHPSPPAGVPPAAPSPVNDAAAAGCEDGCGCGRQDRIRALGGTNMESERPRLRLALLALVVLAVAAILSIKLLGNGSEAVAGEIDGPAWVLFKSPSCHDKKCADFYSLVDRAEESADGALAFYRPSYEEARELAPKLGVRATPCVVVLDQEEREVRRFEGESKEVFAALAAAAAEPGATVR